MTTIDLNCDMGELRPGQAQNYDRDIMPYISSCNIACGFHSGTPRLIEQTIKAAMEHGVQIGAHPSYNDRANFGRKSIRLEPSVLAAEIRYQIAALKGMVESLGGQLHHVKPHGALYNDMIKDPALAQIVIDVIQAIDPLLILVTLAHSPVVDLCKKQGVLVVQEGFADRRYQSRTQLRSRQWEDAVIQEFDAVLAQVDGFRSGQIQLWNGHSCDIEVETICLHSDTSGAVDLSKHIHHHLSQQHVCIAPFS